MTSSPAVMLTGHSGFLGHYLLAELRRRGTAVITAGRRQADVSVDLSDPSEVGAAVAAAAADVVLSCAAMSSMAACESDPDAAHRVNAESVAALTRTGVRVVQVSTDLVFGGEDAPYQAAERPDPCSVYGRTKVAAEASVVAAGGLAVRVPLLFGRSFDGRRGATDMIRAARRPDSLTLFTNEYRTPLHAADAARGLVDLLVEERSGVVHLAGPERLSRWQLLERFAAVVGDVLLDGVQPGENTDPLRPRDVSLVSDVVVGRGLDEALAGS